MLFTRPKKISASFIDPKKSLCPKFQIQKSLGPPVSRIWERGPWVRTAVLGWTLYSENEISHWLRTNNNSNNNWHFLTISYCMFVYGWSVLGLRFGLLILISIITTTIVVVIIIIIIVVVVVVVVVVGVFDVVDISVPVNTVNTVVAIRVFLLLLLSVSLLSFIFLLIRVLSV